MGDTNLKTTSYSAGSYNLFTFSSPVIPELYVMDSVLEIHQLGLSTTQPLFSLFWLVFSIDLSLFWRKGFFMRSTVICGYKDKYLEYSYRFFRLQVSYFFIYLFFHTLHLDRNLHFCTFHSSLSHPSSSPNLLLLSFPCAKTRPPRVINWT